MRLLYVLLSVMISLAVLSHQNAWAQSVSKQTIKTTSESDWGLEPKAMCTTWKATDLAEKAISHVGRTRLEQLASQGDINALFLKATAQRFGISGYKKDDSISRVLLAQAAERGHARAMTGYAYMLEMGQGGSVQRDEALSWNKRAAATGCAVSQYAYAYVLHDGKIVTRDVETAYIYYRQAADQGHTDAQFHMASGYRFGTGNTTKDPYQAVKYYKLAAEGGHTNSASFLGDMYAKGEGIPVNGLLAVAYKKKAAELALESATSTSKNYAGLEYATIAKFYDEGKIIEQNTKLARQYYQQAYDYGWVYVADRLEALGGKVSPRSTSSESNVSADKSSTQPYGVSDKQYISAMCKDIVGKLSKDTRTQILNRSKSISTPNNKRDGETLVLAGMLLSCEDMPEKNEALAAQYLKKTLEYGFGRAANNLGSLYENGRGVSRNEAEAFRPLQALL
jgi:TPR repeat protein